ncbi:MAG TPA: enoyl-CoA hydratase/isomerase family protein [Amycolatopsis sp.]|nr:enoyl-CoA hydratase/isomerase family protein [Amycolatopsis sp.]
MKKRTFDDYRDDYDCATLERHDGVLVMRLQTAGREFRWGVDAHAELPYLFRDIGEDRDNRVVVLTGTGDVFSGPEASPVTRSVTRSMPAADWLRIMREAKQMLLHELEIEVPMIAAVNGPAYRHMELALLCDIVVASEDAVFEDAAHIQHGHLAPGDGMNIVLELLMGVNRARYLHLTAQRLDAVQARDWGLVNEVVPKAQVRDRAMELARTLAEKPDSLLRASRLLMTQTLKKALSDSLESHLLYEGLAQLDQSDPMRR